MSTTTKNNLLLIILAIILGGISGYLFPLSSLDIANRITLFNFLVYYFPGIAFGITMSVWATIVNKNGIIKSLMYTILSTIWFQIAFYGCMFLTGVGLFVLWRFFICGFIGALLLALSNTLLGQVLSKKRILLVSIVGGISGMIFVYSFPLENSVLTFAQWHLLVAMAIGLKLPINNSFTTKSYEKTI